MNVKLKHTIGSSFHRTWSPTFTPTSSPTETAQPSPQGGQVPATARPSKSGISGIGWGGSWGSGTSSPPDYRPVFHSKSSKKSKSSKAKSSKLSKTLRAEFWMEYDGDKDDDYASFSKANKGSGGLNSLVQDEGYTIARVSSNAGERMPEHHLLLGMLVILLPMLL